LSIDENLRMILWFMFYELIKLFGSLKYQMLSQFYN
jgi:hypothetical protein